MWKPQLPSSQTYQYFTDTHTYILCQRNNITTNGLKYLSCSTFNFLPRWSFKSHFKIISIIAHFWKLNKNTWGSTICTFRWLKGCLESRRWKPFTMGCYLLSSYCCSQHNLMKKTFLSLLICSLVSVTYKVLVFWQGKKSLYLFEMIPKDQSGHGKHMNHQTLVGTKDPKKERYALMTASLVHTP